MNESEQIPITRDLLLLPHVSAVAYDEQGRAVEGAPGMMKPPTPGAIDGARRCLAGLYEQTYLLTRWIQTAERQIEEAAKGEQP